MRNTWSMLPILMWPMLMCLGLGACAHTASGEAGTPVGITPDHSYKLQDDDDQPQGGSSVAASISESTSGSRGAGADRGGRHAVAGRVGAVDTPSTRADSRADEKVVGFRVCELPGRDNPLLFSSNSSALRPPSKEVLSQVAFCMTLGQLRHNNVTVIGYADPRGPGKHNRALARARAKAVRSFLIRRGVEPARIAIGQVGEREARGWGPESWQYDRRAELLLGVDCKSLSKDSMQHFAQSCPAAQASRP